MHKFFTSWLLSLILYALAISTVFLVNENTLFTAGYIIRQFIQISALYSVFYTCNMIDNIPYNSYWLRYGIIIFAFVLTYVSIKGVNETVYLAMLIFKLLLVMTILYSIIIKWRFRQHIKLAAVLILGLSGNYLALYDFLIYAYNPTRAIHYICIGIFFLLAQNILFALLYRTQSINQEKLKDDYLSIFAEQSADIIFYYSVSPYPRFAFVSPASKIVLGYSPQDFYNHNFLHIEITTEADREKMEKLFDYNNIGSHDDIITVERKDGEFAHLECSTTNVEVKGKIIAIEGVFRDITERAEAERKMLENNKNRQLMLSYISHDLKTPISYIIAYSESILNNIIKDEEGKLAAIKSIYNRANSLNSLIEDISMLSKLESSRFNYQFEQMRCLDLIEHINETFLASDDSLAPKFPLEGRKYNLIVNDNIEDDSMILVDIERINQVIDNLIINANKATEDGDTITILCKLDRRKKKLLISIIDEGTGISLKDLPHIFENFYHSPSTKKRTDGRGLGLSLSKQIIQGHKGSLSVQSKEGEGAEFTIEIPLFYIDQHSN